MTTVTLYEVVDGVTTTTDAVTQTSLCTFNTATGGPGGTALDNCAMYIEGRVTAYDTTTPSGGGEHIGGAFKVVTGTLTQCGATDHINGTMIEDMPGTPATGFSVSGTTITLFVTGSAGETIKWFGRMFVVLYQPT